MCYAYDASLLTSANSLENLKCAVRQLDDMVEVWLTQNNIQLNVGKPQNNMFPTKCTTTGVNTGQKT